MKEQKRKKRRRWARVFPRLLIVTIIALYFLSRVFPLIGTSREETVVVEYGVIEDLIQTQAIIARDEEVLFQGEAAEIKYFVTQGERVAKGQKLAEVYRQPLGEESQAALEVLNVRIENIHDKKETASIFQRDLEKIDSEVATLLKNIQHDVQEGEYAQLAQYKAELESLSEKRNAILGEDSFAGKNLNQLMEQKNYLESKLQSSVFTIESQSPGYVIFQRDGLEDLINLNTIEHLTPEDFLALEATTVPPAQESVEGEQVQEMAIKLVNSYQWSAVLRLTPEQTEGLTEGKNIKVRQRGDTREHQGKIRKIIEGEGANLVILDFSDAIESAYLQRRLDLEIIKTRYEGAMIPQEAITEVDNQTGVYRVNVNGQLRWIPVKIKGGNEKYAVVYDTSFESTDPETKEPTVVRTVNLYDELVLRADQVKEGQKIIK